MTIVYLVRYRGLHYVCVPGAVTAKDPDDPAEARVRLCWTTRDGGQVICHDGEEDEVVRLEEFPDAPKKPCAPASPMEERFRSILRPRGDGWLPNDSGTPPEPDAVVDVLMQGGALWSRRPAHTYDWRIHVPGIEEVIWWRPSP